MTMLNKTGKNIILVLTVLLLCSCESNSPKNELQRYLAKVKSDAANQKDESLDNTLRVATPIPPTAVKYQAMAKRSPFEKIESAAVKQNHIITSPLQGYPLDVLRFVGTVTQNSVTAAFVAAPDNRIYQIKVGDLISDHFSKVLTIDAHQITLLDNSSVDDGAKSVNHVVTLPLKEAN